MDRFRFRSYFDDALFVVLIMAAAIASAAMEVGAVVGAFSPQSVARMPSRPAPATAAASSVDGALLSVAAPRPRR